MNARTCCRSKTHTDDPAPRFATRLRRGSEIARWIVPTTTLVLLPKCPMCLAAYVGLATGIGISLPAAMYLQATLVVVCMTSLTFIAARRLRGFVRAQRLTVEEIG